MPKNGIVFCPEMEVPYSIHRSQNLCDSLPHSHPFWELILFERGEGQHIINGVAYPFRPGDMVLLSPTDIHAWINKEGTTHDCTKVTFTYNVYFTHFSDACHFRQLPAMASLCQQDMEKAQHLLNMLADEFNAPHRPGSITFGLDLIEPLIILLQRNLPEHKSDQQENAGRIRKILQYLQEHFHEPITITDAAKALNYSPKYFSRLFCREFGIPFQEYLKSLRLNHAYHLIKYSDLPVADICYNSGFHSPTYFSTSFKEKYGQSPNNLRKQKDP